MEFNEKLQHLRKQYNLTQEQLAEKLFVSRTAVSKWESGKGYPNIESLKCISKVFGVSIDELLSSKELIDAAEAENCTNLKKAYAVIIGLIDVMAIAFIILPLYGNPVDGKIYSVSLFSFAAVATGIRAIYWFIFILIITTGIFELLCTHLGKDRWNVVGERIVFFLSIIAILFFAVVKEPYVITLLFLLFLAKLFLLIKQKSLK